jgi:hypothetical protein
MAKEAGEVLALAHYLHFWCGAATLSERTRKFCT